MTSGELTDTLLAFAATHGCLTPTLLHPDATQCLCSHDSLSAEPHLVRPAPYIAASQLLTRAIVYVPTTRSPQP